ncbi:MAG TPA: methyltransferase [Candidatus Limnocylindrales bacterium]|nr:methyltransferase [Candidatus Limnocylindrales bacterium]
MQHQDHVALIRGGVEGAGPRWLELGAGNGEFTLALADVLGDAGSVVALDRDASSLAELARRLATRFPGTALETLAGDLTEGLPPGPFDGVLAANSLHYVRDLGPVLASIRDLLRPGGRLVLVEYDAERGNPWVPYPISFRRWSVIASDSGFTAPRRLHRVPSRFLDAIYGAVAERPSS